MKVKHKKSPFLINISERTLYMKFPFFASFVIFILILHHNMNRGRKSSEQQEAEYWKHEFDANHIRKQSLDDLDYISFHAEPFYPLMLLGAETCGDFLANHPDAKEILSRFLYLEHQKIVNLGCFSNTELKYKYGVANLNLLTEYDSNFSELVTLLQNYAVLFLQAGFEDQALTILEYAISIGSDISKTYTSCAEIYHNRNQLEKLDWLKKEAETISTSRKDSILHKLQEFHSYID